MKTANGRQGTSASTLFYKRFQSQSISERCDYFLMTADGISIAVNSTIHLGINLQSQTCETGLLPAKSALLNKTKDAKVCVEHLECPDKLCQIALFVDWILDQILEPANGHSVDERVGNASVPNDQPQCQGVSLGMASRRPCETGAAGSVEPEPTRSSLKGKSTINREP